MSNRTRDTQVETDQFSREITGLPEAHLPETVELGDGERFEIEIAPVAKRLGDVTVRMLAYNRSIPGPTLKVRQDSEVLINVTNRGDLEATVHWHGVRVENRYDGTHQTQAPIAVGESFTYHVQFPDPGVYWYHPHIREDYGQELGLYGNIIVVPAEPEYWPPANRELPLTLDDVLLDEEGKIAPFSHHETTYVAMGRFGDVLLIGGETDLALRARLGEVMRFYFTDTANTRVFKVGLPGARMKLVGGDSGRHEHEEFVDDVLLAPSERVVVDVLFEEAGELTLEHRTPERTYPLASITVDEEPAAPSFAKEFEVLRTNPELLAERERIAPYLEAPPDKILALVAEMDLGGPEVEAGAVFACPMHPEIIASWAGKCPKCGMKLLPAEPGVEAPVDDVLLAPSERVVVDVLFEEAGELTLEHRTPERGSTTRQHHRRRGTGRAVVRQRVRGSASTRSWWPSGSGSLPTSRPRRTRFLPSSPRSTKIGGPEVEAGAAFVCPMHPEIIASWAGKCPKCGMKLLPAEPGTEAPPAYACPMHPEVTATWSGTCPSAGSSSTRDRGRGRRRGRC